MLMITSGSKVLEGIEKRKKELRALLQSADVTVDWTWYDQNQGIVSWNFSNNSNAQKTVVLYRNGYYFGNAFWCFKPDEILLGDNKPISEYKPGDLVMGMNGLTRVVAVGKRKVGHGEGLIRIKANGMIPLEVTPDHPVLTVSNINNKGGVKIVGFTEPKFIKASELKPKETDKEGGNYLLIPRIKQTKDPVKEVDLTRFCSEGYENQTVRTSFPINSDTAWLLGLYTAEGYTGGKDMNNAGFALNIKEEDIALKAKKIIEDLGYSARIVKRSDRGSQEVIVSSRVLAKALNEWCGHGAHNKKIPDFILYNTDDILKSFLEGLIDGDGSYVSGEQSYISFATVSKILAMQFQLAWARLGKFASISIWNGGTSFINGKPVKSGKQYRVRIFSESLHAKFTDDFIYVPIRKVEKVDYDGYVYDLQTENNTIVAANAVTHNCVYVANNMTYWATSLTPLQDNGVANNTMPIGIVDFGNGKRIVAFLFTLAPGQKWSVLEGGFSTLMPPADASVFEVSLEKVGSFCVYYDPQQVIDWDMQTGTQMQGYSPDPSYISTLEVLMPQNAQYVQLFPKDYITDSQCQSSPPSCMDIIEAGIDNGNAEEIVEGIMCLINEYGISVKHVIHRLLDRL